MTVTFNYTGFIARYPEFATVNSQLAQAYFNEACVYCDNTGESPITSDAKRALLLNMMVAHIAFVNAEEGGGIVTSAAEGSVSASFQVPLNCPAFYAQSKYGVAYWQATTQYRIARIVPGSPRRMDPYGLC